MKIRKEATLTIDVTASEKLALDRAGVGEYFHDTSDVQGDIFEIEDKIEELEEKNKKVPKYLRTTLEILMEIESEISEVADKIGMYEVYFQFPKKKKRKK